MRFDLPAEVPRLGNVPMHVHTCLRPARTQNALESFSLRELPILHLLFHHPSEAGVRFAGENRWPAGVMQSGTQSKLRAEMELSLRALFLSANPQRVTGVRPKQAEQGILKPDRCWRGGGRNTEVEGPTVMGSITGHYCVPSILCGSSSFILTTLEARHGGRKPCLVAASTGRDCLSGPWSHSQAMIEAGSEM